MATTSWFVDCRRQPARILRMRDPRFVPTEDPRHFNAKILKMMDPRFFKPRILFFFSFRNLDLYPRPLSDAWHITNQSDVEKIDKPCIYSLYIIYIIIWFIFIRTKKPLCFKPRSLVSFRIKDSRFFRIKEPRFFKSRILFLQNENPRFNKQRILVSTNKGSSLLQTNDPRYFSNMDLRHCHMDNQWTWYATFFKPQTYLLLKPKVHRFQTKDNRFSNRGSSFSK